MCFINISVHSNMLNLGGYFDTRCFLLHNVLGRDYLILPFGHYSQGFIILVTEKQHRPHSRICRLGLPAFIMETHRSLLTIYRCCLLATVSWISVFIACIALSPRLFDFRLTRSGSFPTSTHSSLKHIKEWKGDTKADQRNSRRSQTRTENLYRIHSHWQTILSTLIN